MPAGVHPAAAVRPAGLARGGRPLRAGRVRGAGVRLEPGRVEDSERPASTVGHSPAAAPDRFDWVVHDDASGAAVGYVQATVDRGTADLAWTIEPRFRGRGLARAAATALVGWLHDHGVTTLVAHVHPDQLASAAVARGLGLVATGRLVDAEVEWRSGAVQPAVTVGPATDLDPSRLLAFWSVAAEDAHRPADSGAAVRRLLDRDPDALLTATMGDVLVGTVIAGSDGWRCHLYRLAVHPTWRRRGIARLLVAAAEARFATFGAARADAMVLDDNPDAHALWAGLGYTRQAEWSRWVKGV